MYPHPPWTPADLPAIEDLYREFAALHAAADPSFAMVPHAGALFARYVGEQLAGDEARVLVADAGEVVGVALGQLRLRPPVYPDPRMGWIDTVCVRERLQRLGVGTRLVHGLMAWFEARGVHRVELTAAIRNERAVRFWRKAGFVPYLEQLYHAGPLGPGPAARTPRAG